MFRKNQWLGLVAIAGITLAGVAGAQDLGGLGKHWPNSADLSRNASYHAYRFDRDGVEYIQVNDRDGNPQLAAAVGGSTVLVLPVGNPSAVQLTTPAVFQAVGGAVVYSDNAISISVTPAGYLVAPAAGGKCTDQADCSTADGATAAPAAQSRMANTGTCNDPIECTRVN